MKVAFPSCPIPHMGERGIYSDAPPNSNYAPLSSARTAAKPIFCIQPQKLVETPCSGKTFTFAMEKQKIKKNERRFQVHKQTNVFFQQSGWLCVRTKTRNCSTNLRCLSRTYLVCTKAHYTRLHRSTTLCIFTKRSIVYKEALHTKLRVLLWL